MPISASECFFGSLAGQKCQYGVNMANRYLYKGIAGSGNFKPKMVNIEGKVNIGTGGLPDAQTASGTCYGRGAPSGWQGSYSGVVGMLKGGINSVVRTTTGTYQLGLEDGWSKDVNSVQVTYFAGVTGSVGTTGVIVPGVALTNVGNYA